MRKTSSEIVIVLFVGLAGLAAACSEGDNQEPSDPVVIGDGDGDVVGDGDGDVPGDGDGDVPGDGDGDVPGDGDGDIGGAPGDGDGDIIVDPIPGREDCPEEPDSEVDEGSPIAGDACWDVSDCNGVSTAQFLNQCSDFCIEPFDNEARITGFTGTLPPL